MAMTSLCLGVGFSTFMESKLKYRIRRIDSLLMTGLIIATVYAQFFSLFTKVGLLANLILVIVCIVIAVLCRKSMMQYVKSAWKDTSTARKIIVLALVLLWAYFTSYGYLYYDSDLYHGQSIRWIEEYGIVPGLGNLHERFAYNSSLFALSALYSLKFVLGYSMHAMTGFFALVLSLSVLDITASWKNRKFVLSDFAKAAAIYYLTMITDEVVSPASDLAIMCVIFFIIIKWLDCLEQKEQCVTPYALLCVAGVYALTLKLTAGLILVLLIKPAYQLIKEKRVKEIIFYLSMGLIVAIPWFARTVIISGWLLYPFAALDIFNFDWKIPVEVVEVDSTNISVWGKALYDVNLIDTPFHVWVKNWFITTLSTTEKLLILGDVCSTLLFLVGFVWMVVKKKWQHLDIALVIATMICSYVFWQFSAPLVRYGYAYVLLLNFLVVGFIIKSIGFKPMEMVVYFALMLYGAYKVVVLADYISGSYLHGHYVWQQDYNEYELETYEVGGYIFYKPIIGDRTGYQYFPAAPSKADIELRGEGLEDGFRRK